MSENDFLRRQLDQTKRELSEVIDEVVFVERARAEAEHRNVASAMKLAALEEELRIVKQQLAHSPSRSSSQAQAAGGGFGSPGGGYQQQSLQDENSALRGEIAALQAQQLSHTDMTLSAQRATTARVEDLARQLQSSEQVIDQLRRRLQAEDAGQHAQLLQQANEALQNPTSATTAAQLVELRGRIEQMARDAQLRQSQVEMAVEKLRQSGNNAAASTVMAAAAGGGNDVVVAAADDSMSKLGPGSPGDPRTRLLAFEKTVQSLNVELASKEQQLREMEALYNDQQVRFANARKEMEADMRECDQVVAALAAELEQLMDDNARLRSQMRTKSVDVKPTPVASN